MRTVVGCGVSMQASKVAGRSHVATFCVQVAGGSSWVRIDALDTRS